MMRPRGRCPSLSVLQWGQKSGASEKRKEGKEKLGKVLTWALNGDTALHGQPLLLLWFFPSILDPIFVLPPAMLLLHNPCHHMWQRTHIPIIPCSDGWEHCLMWSWADTCVFQSATTGRGFVQQKDIVTDSHYCSVNSRDWWQQRSVKGASNLERCLFQSFHSEGKTVEEKHVGWFHLWQFKLCVCLFHHQQICNKLVSRNISWKIKATVSPCIYLTFQCWAATKISDFLWEHGSITRSVLLEGKPVGFVELLTYFCAAQDQHTNHIFKKCTKQWIFLDVFKSIVYKTEHLSH